VQGGQSQFTEYWEGNLLRDNPNLGTFKSSSFALMGAWGATNRLNIMAMLPYISNKGTASYFAPQQGIQDLSLFAKYNLLTKKMSGDLKIFASAGVSTPIGNYEAEILPFSIGLGSSTVSVRSVANYTHQTGFYATLQLGHTWRSNVKLNRDAFLYDGKMYNTNIAPVANVIDGSVAFGYIRPRLQAEVSYRNSQCLTGDNIRYNDMPFLTNKMNGESLNALVKVYVTPRLALGINGSRVLSGLNIGKSTSLAASVFYIFGKMGETTSN
jgi:hypothetical protein